MKRWKRSRGRQRGGLVATAAWGGADEEEDEDEEDEDEDEDVNDEEEK